MRFAVLALAAVSLAACGAGAGGVSKRDELAQLCIDAKLMPIGGAPDLMRKVCECTMDEALKSLQPADVDVLVSLLKMPVDQRTAAEAKLPPEQGERISKIAYDSGFTCGMKFAPELNQPGVMPQQ